jgi:regulatory protein
MPRRGQAKDGEGRAAPARSALGDALLRLSRRDHSEAELRRALRRGGHGDDEVERALERLRARRFLDDASYAERFARSRLQHAGLGSRRLKQALLTRGVPRPLAERGVKAASAQVGEGEVLERVARAYWRGHPRDEPAARLRKLWGFLLRRGFPPGLVRERLASWWPRPFRELPPDWDAPDLGDNPED